MRHVISVFKITAKALSWALLLCVGAVLLVISAGALVNYMFSRSGRQKKSLHVLRVVNAAVVRIAQAF